MIINALSVDVEEYFHTIEFEAALSPDQLERLPSRIEESVDRVLCLLSEHGVQGTFFIVGQVAEQHAAMVRSIDEEGHEVACHSYRHELVSKQSPQEFRADIRRAKAILEDLCGQPVVGYRAPMFSIGAAQAWAYNILSEEGFRYDSSVYPIFHDRYGDPYAPRFPYVIEGTGSPPLIEFPIGTARFCGVNVPVSGGHFRLAPVDWIQRCIQRVNKYEGQPVMFYFHPWELDPNQPRPAMPLHHRFRHYVGLRQEADKLWRLLWSCRFTTAQAVLHPYLSSKSRARGNAKGSINGAVY